MNLRIPGPTPLPPEVLKIMSKQMINHRGKEFSGIVERVTQRLKEFFKTKGDVFLLTGSGTGGMEAAVVNTLSPADKVLVLNCGYFGERFAEIARRFGADVNRLDFEWGKPVDPDAVRRALQQDPKIKAVLVTHNETSTGVTNDLAAISKVVREFDKLLLVDAISSLGCIDLPTDEWGCDVVITGSQKGWMAPPGVAMVNVSTKAWQAHAQAKMPRYYWDFTLAKDFLAKKQTPWTPAVTTFYALDTGLELMAKEGYANILARHARIARFTRDGIKSLGMSIFPEEKYASNTITAANAPAGLDVKKLLQILTDEKQTILQGGQGKLEVKIFRIGHLGWVSEKEISEVMDALKVTLPKAGYTPPV